MSASKRTGRVWKFGDDIDTDLMLPGYAHDLSPDLQAKAVFSANRPGWADLVRPGDILVAGRNFGCGSSRPAPRVLRRLGLSALLADSYNSLFYRNCVNFGLAAFDCPGISGAVEEGDVVEIDLTTIAVTNKRTGLTRALTPTPEPLLEMMLNGGLYPVLELKGFVKPAG